MSLRKTLLIISAIFAAASIATAQTPYSQGKYRERGSGTSMTPRTGKTPDRMGIPKTKPDMSVPSGYKGYSDEKLDELDKTMKEREWLSEDTAWKRACEINTRLSYETYIARYPIGAHIAEARCRLIDAKVQETLDNAHDDLPNIKHIETDDFSLTSTVIVKNNTGYPLTVYYSGDNSKSIVIQPDAKASVTLQNGPYKIAATVPPSYIRPFAGKTEFAGGTYEIGFWVVSY